MVFEGKPKLPGVDEVAICSIDYSVLTKEGSHRELWVYKKGEDDFTHHSNYSLNADLFLSIKWAIVGRKRDYIFLQNAKRIKEEKIYLLGDKGKKIFPYIIHLHLENILKPKIIC